MACLVKMRCVGQRWFLCCLFAVGLVAIALPAVAADRFWIDRTGGGYTSTSNWQDHLIALDGDIAHFGVSDLFNPQANYTVTFGTNIKIQLLLVEDDIVTFDLNGHSYETTGNVTTCMIIGNSSSRSGQFTVTDGIVIAPLNSGLSVGNLGTGQLTVSTGGLLIGSPKIAVGGGANGTLVINNGGDIIASDVTIAALSGHTGAATITGASSSLLAAALHVGKAASGTLDILASGRVDSSSGTIASAAGITGTVNVDGTNSQWNDSGELKIGNAGAGTLNITAGGKVQDTNGFIAFDGGGGTVLVSGANSQWINSGVVQVGLFGKGTLTISDGGFVKCANGNVGGFNHNGVALVSGAGSSWDAGFINVGFVDGTGQLTIEKGASISSTEGSIGAGSGSNGTANVTGVGSTWSNAGNLAVGDQGTGTLNVIGTTVTNTGSLTVGNSGSGTLAITAGGSISNTSGHVGLASGGTGTVNLDGANSQWINSSELRIGESGSGTVNISAGGRLQNTIGFLGYGTSGTANVDGSNSRWINSSILQVGFNGPGSFNVTGGAHVESLGGTIAISASSVSTAAVSGAGSTWTNTGSLTVGLNGNGALTIAAGGSVSNTDVSIGILAGSTGTVTVGGNGSTWTINGALGVGVDATSGDDGGMGVLRIQAGGTVSVAADTTIGDSTPGHMNQLILEGGTFTAPDISFRHAFKPFFWTSGTLHTGIYHGNIIVPNGGVLAPGNSAGVTKIEGDYSQGSPGATLQIEIGGTTSGTQYDKVNVTGNVFLGGSLQLAMLNGFVPNAVDTFTILDAAGSLSGSFANAASGQRLATSNGLGSFIVNYGPGSAFNQKQIVLSSFLATSLAGDYNHNGVVDAADYTVWRDTLGSTTDLRANGDNTGASTGKIDQADYTFWRTHFGNHTGSGAAEFDMQSAVPEPCSFALLFVALVLGVAVSRDRGNGLVDGGRHALSVAEAADAQPTLLLSQ